MDKLKRMAQHTINEWIYINNSHDKDVMMSELFDQKYEHNKVVHSEMECWNLLEESYELWDIINYTDYDSNLINLMNKAWEKVGHELIYQDNLKEKWDVMRTKFFKDS